MHLYTYPNGVQVRAREGGHVNLSRPWQTEMVGSPSCPFCSDSAEEHELNVYTDVITGWRLRKNKFPAGPIHYMIMPGCCWVPANLRTLGGLANIKIAFKMAYREIAKHSDLSLQLVVHIGPAAGQNQGHLHWHLAQRDEVIIPESFVNGLAAIFRRNGNLVILDDEDVFVGIGGIRAGQCFIMPWTTQTDFEKLAETVNWLVDLFNQKFVSKEGMTPDFSITLRFQNGFFYGVFIPTLSHWGSTEYAAIHEGLPVLLPWPHELTTKHLFAKQ